MFIQDLKMVYTKAIQETLKRIKNNPIILILPAIYAVLFYFAGMLLSRLVGTVSSLASGFIYPILYALILSSYYEILSDLNSYGRITFKNIKNTFTRNFATIYSIFFVMTIANYLVLPITGSLYPIALLAIFILFNPVAETAYIRGESFTNAFVYALNFMKENIIHWSLPLIIYMLVLFLVGGMNSVFYVISNIASIPMGVNFGEVNLIPFIIIEIVVAIYAVMRGVLFNILSKSTMRKRAYMGGIN